MRQTEGWVSLDNARKFHYFDRLGRSGCNKYIYRGRSFIDVTPEFGNAEDTFYDPMFCQKCQDVYLGGRQQPG